MKRGSNHANNCSEKRPKKDPQNKHVYDVDRMNIYTFMVRYKGT